MLCSDCSELSFDAGFAGTSKCYAATVPSLVSMKDLQEHQNVIANDDDWGRIFERFCVSV